MKMRVLVVIGCGVIAIAGCKKTADNKLNYSNAIDQYYATRPACLWADEIKFPVQVTTSDAEKTQGYDALVDQGLLVRTTAEKKVFILGSKQVTNYDLSDSGRKAWTADPNQPGYGNLCYGTRTVSSIDNATPTSAQPGAKTVVNYHYRLTGVPSWASAAETQTAFPQVRADLTGPAPDAATLMDTNSGWAVSSPLPGSASHAPASAADGKIVP